MIDISSIGRTTDILASQKALRQAVDPLGRFSKLRNSSEIHLLNNHAQLLSKVLEQQSSSMQMREVFAQINSVKKTLSAQFFEMQKVLQPIVETLYQKNVELTMALAPQIRELNLIKQNLAPYFKSMEILSRKYNSTINAVVQSIDPFSINALVKVLETLPYEDCEKIAKDSISEIEAMEDFEISETDEISHYTEKFITKLSETPEDSRLDVVVQEIRLLREGVEKANKNLRQGNILAILLFTLSFMGGFFFWFFPRKDIVDIFTPERNIARSIPKEPTSTLNQDISMMELDGVYYRAVRPQVLYVRSAPSGKATVVDCVYSGENVLVVNSANKYWRKVRLRTEEGLIEGWVRAKYLGME